MFKRLSILAAPVFLAVGLLTCSAAGAAEAPAADTNLHLYTQPNAKGTHEVIYRHIGYTRVTPVFLAKSEINHTGLNVRLWDRYNSSNGTCAGQYRTIPKDGRIHNIQKTVACVQMWR